MSLPKKPLVLVDGSSYLYRAFHALPLLTNAQGFPTGAIYGVINMLKRLIADFNPEWLVVVFDSKGKTFRDELYPDYKATRSAMPSELAQQIEPIHRLIKALGLPLLMIEGVEADDVIGTIATQASLLNIPVIISTGDKDLTQLVNEHITLINTMTNVRLDRKGVEEKFGVPPERIIDYLTLVGDSSDNIKGVSQVGPKTAVKWLKEFGSLDNIVIHAEKITGKVGEKLRESLDHLPLTKNLVTIKRDVELVFDLMHYTIKTADQETLLNLYQELGFKNWLKELTPKPSLNESSLPPVLINNTKALAAAAHELAKTNLLALSIKTTDQHYSSAEWIAIALKGEQTPAYYVPIAQQTDVKNLSLQEVLSILKPLIENTELKKALHHAKFVIEMFANVNIQLKGLIFDSELAAYVEKSAYYAPLLQVLSQDYLGLLTKTYEEIAGKGAKQIAFADLPFSDAFNFLTTEVTTLLALEKVLMTKINESEGLNRIYREIELPLVPVLASMEQQGVMIDKERLKIQENDLKKRINELEKEAYHLVGEKFNLNSPKQLQEILFQKLKLPVLQKTSTGQASTADSVLQELIDYPLPKIIIEYRSLSKLISTYTTPLVKQINPITHRVHTSYNQTGTITGRLSSSEPNLQNIPIRLSEGRRIRQAFIAPAGFKIVSADYSQIELRLMAHIAEDEGLLRAFLENIDVHTMTAAEVWGIPLKEVTSNMRRDAKAINFGLLYGMSAFGLSRQLGVDRKAAENYIKRYFARYPRVQAYMENTRAIAESKGYVETLWGRRLYIPDIKSQHIPRQKAALRAAINAPLQGSAADIIKLAMINIDQWIKNQSLNLKMIMQVHDELVFEIGEKDLEQLLPQIKTRMSSVATLKVPLDVSIGIGDNWDEASNH